MFNNIMLAFTVAVLLIIFTITILKKEFIKNIYTTIKREIPNYVYKILYIVIVILIIFLIVVQIMNYMNINIFK